MLCIIGSSFKRNEKMILIRRSGIRFQNTALKFFKYSTLNHCVDDDLCGISSNERQFRKKVFNLCQDHLSPYVPDIQKQNGWDKQNEFWKKLGAMGLFGITVPKKFG